MNKEEFLESLRKKLNVLEEGEITDIISEYSGYIEEKVNSGLTEREAIKEFGNINELVQDILSAYKVKTNNEEKNMVENITTKVSNFIDLLISKFEGKNAKDIIRFFLQVLTVIIIIGLCKIPFLFIEDFGHDLLFSFDNRFLQALGDLWKLVIEICYLILAAIAFVKIIKTKFLNEQIITEKTKDFKISPEAKEEKNKAQTVGVEKTKGFINFLTDVCHLFFKFILFWILLGVASYVIFSVFCLSIDLILIIKGIKYYGIFLILIAFLILGLIFFEILFKILTEKKNNWTKIFVVIMAILILLGIGGGITALDIAKTEVINYTEYNQTVIQDIKMKEDLVILENYNMEYKIDNEIDNIKIVFNYNDTFLDLNKEVYYQQSNILFVGANYYLKWNKKLFDDFLEEIQKYRVFNYNSEPQIIIYVNEKNYEKLKTNYNNYESRYLLSIEERDLCSCE